MKQYAAYKDSGIEWIGEIPEDWRMLKNSWLFQEISSGTTPNISNREYYDGNIPWLNTGDLNDGYITETTKTISHLALDTFSTLKYYQPNSLVIAMYGATIGKMGITCIKLCTNQACCVMSKPFGNEIKYIFYLFLAARDNLIALAYGGGQPNISQSIIRNIRFCIPPQDQQRVIINFLDRKTSAIDALIADKSRMIELLCKRRQAIISEAVTKGLDKGVPMKDSGVEWIGKVPTHWAIKQMRRFFNYYRGLSITKSDLIEEGIPCISYGEIHSKVGIALDTDAQYLKCVSEEYYKTAPDSLLSQGDFVFADTSEDIEGSGNFTCIVSSTPVFAGYHTVIARQNATPCFKYLSYFFDSLGFRTQIRVRVSGIKVYSITQMILKEIYVLLPPLDEQIRISNYLHSQTNRIDALVSDIEAQIERLKEYRQSLISEAVTGKINVCEETY